MQLARLFFRVPLASFDLTDRAQLLRVVHHSNLRPMWARENIRKGATVAL